jgi:hypothetical protein
MSEKMGLKSIIPSWKEIGFMVVRGFGLFLSVSGMVGMTLILGPLNHIIQDLDINYTLVFGSKPPAFFACMGLAVVGGALDFFANLGLKGLEK